MLKTAEILNLLLTISGSYLPAIKQEVEEMMREYDLRNHGMKPRKYASYSVGGKLIKRASFKAAYIGGLTSVPATIPIVGNLGTVIACAAVDLALVMRLQLELCYAISAAYDVDVSEDELKAVSLAILGFTGSAEALKATAATVLRGAVNEIADSYIKKGIEKATIEVAEKLIPRMLGKVYKLLPLIGVPIGASVNIASTMMVGNQARKYFSVWNDDDDLLMPRRSLK